MLLDDKAQKAQIGRQWLQAAACLTRLGLSSVHTAWSTQLMHYTQKIADTEFKSRTKKVDVTFDLTKFYLFTKQHVGAKYSFTGSIEVCVVEMN